MPHCLSAQVVVPPASEIPVPPKPETDTTAKAKKDTIKAPFGRLVGPRTADIGPQYEWNREQMFASGAYTVADLLERVPGTTGFRTGWLASPKFVAVNGDMARIRVFYDGIEMDNLDSRSGPVLDLTTVELWTLENVSIERAADELRVHLRTWRVDNTNSYTRTDVYTGDEDTNIYRGYYGKRFDSGGALQLAGQQFNTRSPRLGGGGDALSFIARVGIARRLWSIDVFGQRRNAARVLQPTFGSGLSLAPFEGTQTLGYVRAGLGNPAGGPWLQAIASHTRLAEKTSHVTASDALARLIRPDTSDTTTKRIQYLLAAGIAKGPLRTSVTDRVRAFEGEVTHSPSGRVELGGSYGTLAFYAERNGETERNHYDGIARFTPLSFIALGGAISLDEPKNSSLMFPNDDESDTSSEVRVPKMKSARIEAGLRLWKPWLIGGLVTRDTAVLLPPSVIDSAYTITSVGRRRGLYGGLRGTLFKDLNVDVIGTRWDTAGFYQPRYQARSELNLDTRWLSRFPSGSFGLKIAGIYEYRDGVRFPTAEGDRVTASSTVLSALLEIRILRGVASYQVRNLTGYQYQVFPDFFMPRSIGVYGIRWEFWN
jgi:hypothetical protein